MAYKKIEKENYTMYVNECGEVIGTKGAPVLEVDGYIFKDLEGTASLRGLET